MGFGLGSSSLWKPGKLFNVCRGFGKSDSLNTFNCLVTKYNSTIPFTFLMSPLILKSISWRRYRKWKHSCSAVGEFKDQRNNLFLLNGSGLEPSGSVLCNQGMWEEAQNLRCLLPVKITILCPNSKPSMSPPGFILGSVSLLSLKRKKTVTSFQRWKRSK